MHTLYHDSEVSCHGNYYVVRGHRTVSRKLGVLGVADDKLPGYGGVHLKNPRT